MEKTYYKISEVAEIIGESQATLRFWEKEFIQHLNVHKVKNTRYYTADNIETIKDIQYLLREADYKIEGAKAKLTNDRQKTTNKRNIADRLQSIKKELIAIRRELNTTSFAKSVIID